MTGLLPAMAVADAYEPQSVDNDDEEPTTHLGRHEEPTRPVWDVRTSPLD
jgi:hypothetical protein